jgi:hypothetical protein
MSANLMQLFVREHFGTRLGKAPPTPRANPRKWIRIQTKDGQLTKLCGEDELSDQAREQLRILKEALDNKTSSSTLDLGELKHTITPNKFIVMPTGKTFVPSLAFPDVNPAPVAIALPATKPERGWWQTEVYGTEVFPGRHDIGAPNKTCLGERRSSHAGEIMSMLRLLRQPDTKAGDISTPAVTRSDVNRYARRLADAKQLLMALKTISDFDHDWPAHKQDHGWKAPVMPTTLVLAGLKEGILSASDCRHVHTCTCREKHYMFPHEGGVIALEGRPLSQYSLRVCLSVNSMQDPHHRKRQRQQAREQAHDTHVPEVPCSGAEEGIRRS